MHDHDIAFPRPNYLSEAFFHPSSDPAQALADLLYQLLAALALALRARIVALLVVAVRWSDDDDGDSCQHKRHSAFEGSKARRCRLSPPPCDGEPAQGSWWRPAVLLPPQAPHLSGRLTVSFSGSCQVFGMSCVCGNAVLRTSARCASMCSTLNVVSLLSGAAHL